LREWFGRNKIEGEKRDTLEANLGSCRSPEQKNRTSASRSCGGFWKTTPRAGVPKQVVKNTKKRLEELPTRNSKWGGHLINKKWGAGGGGGPGLICKEIETLERDVKREQAMVFSVNEKYGGGDGGANNPQQGGGGEKKKKNTRSQCTSTHAIQ